MAEGDHLVAVREEEMNSTWRGFHLKEPLISLGLLSLQFLPLAFPVLGAAIQPHNSIQPPRFSLIVRFSLRDSTLFDSTWSVLATSPPCLPPPLRPSPTASPKEWRAQQIANGEAKDNANFEPLGGDWNVIHGSDAVESARKEIALWFPEGIAEWRSGLHPWIYE
ncbi:unnamed protein product [Fraxinus pennsylvanica]|uniref:Nucleoside-diphosphate kinase n=1 Tax=Fraxinus pennsylvanica TaxID=56036 RepID=A0AAD1YSZ9_9LAMI|nr:unnamed protein product [Fraxinus pennsylvanica]